MPDDFTKYEQMKTSGASPVNVYRAGKADKLGPVASIRMLRHVFGMSLVDAKKVIGADSIWSEKQEISPGAVVYWESWDTVDGLSILQARVKEIKSGQAVLEGHKRFQVKGDNLVEVPVGNALESLKVSYLELPLTERLDKLFKFVNDLANLSK